jgi:hypothetical protein
MFVTSYVDPPYKKRVASPFVFLYFGIFGVLGKAGGLLRPTARRRPLLPSWQAPSLLGLQSGLVPLGLVPLQLLQRPS